HGGHPDRQLPEGPGAVRPQAIRGQAARGAGTGPAARHRDRPVGHAAQARRAGQRRAVRGLEPWRAERRARDGIMALPSTGDSNWGVPLNSFITNVVLAEANAAAASIATHVAAGDPHGDRAYAQQLLSPLTSGVNGPNGFLQLSST